MKKLLIAVLAFFVFQSDATAEKLNYEASGVITYIDSSGTGTAADGLVELNETFTVQFTIDTKEELATYNDYLPQSESANYFNTHPILVEFSGGLVVGATPLEGADLYDSRHRKSIYYDFSERHHALSVYSPGTAFSFSEPIATGISGINLSFSEYGAPHEITTIELSELPALQDLDASSFGLYFSAYDDDGNWEGHSGFYGQIEALELISAKKQKEKQLVCHVGNEAGPNDETYLDDPDCVPNDANGYFCPDAGKIDLIVVPKHAKHIGNPSHSWDGISDYLPEELGASGEGTEDSDGNGIDDGCEPVDVCPCWESDELLSVTADNQGELSCSGFIYGGYPYNVYLYSDNTQPGVNTSFSAFEPGWYGFEAKCLVSEGRGSPITSVVLSDQELSVCVNQIADRCAAIGDPITQ